VLTAEPPQEIVEQFIETCRKHHLARAAAFTGGLEDPHPDGWRGSVSLISTALRADKDGKDAVTPALDPRWLHAPVQVVTKEEGAVVSIGFFDPTDRRPRLDDIQLADFELEKSPAGAWRLKLPAWLGGSAVTPSPNQSSNDLRKALPLALIHKAGARACDSPEALGEVALQALVSDDFPAVAGLVQVEDPEAAVEVLFHYARRWSEFQTTGNLGFPLAHHRDGDRACVVYLEIDPYWPGFHDDALRWLSMARSAEGWRLAPDPATLPEPLQQWLDETRPRLAEGWLQRIGLTHLLGGLPAGPAPEPEATRGAARAWADALQSRDAATLFKHVAMFDDESSLLRLFSFIGQELPNPAPREILGIHRHGRWAAASIRHHPAAEGAEPTDLLHPVVSTADGPMVLPEAILYTSDNRARQFLNREVFKRLGQRLPEPALDELRSLLDEHDALCRPDPAPAPDPEK
jgi:hypothetical protein